MTRDEQMKGSEIYLVEWLGSREPRGLRHNNTPVSLMNGAIVNPKGDKIGVYERLLDGGPDGKRHRVILVVYCGTNPLPPVVANPPHPFGGKTNVLKK